MKKNKVDKLITYVIAYVWDVSTKTKLFPAVRSCVIRIHTVNPWSFNDFATKVLSVKPGIMQGL